jgi:hypothetical protein
LLILATISIVACLQEMSYICNFLLHGFISLQFHCLFSYIVPTKILIYIFTEKQITFSSCLVLDAKVGIDCKEAPLEFWGTEAF